MLQLLQGAEQHNMEYLNQRWNWFKKRAHNGYARFWLLLSAFMDSWFIFFPPELLLVAMVAAGAEFWILYAGITTLMSVVGALFGYMVGFFFFDSVGVTIISLVNGQDIFAQARDIYTAQVFWIALITASTPIPYIPFTLSAGFFGVNVYAFALGSLLGRAIRFFAIAYIVRFFGKRVLTLATKYSNIATIVIAIAIIAYLLHTFGVF